MSELDELREAVAALAGRVQELEDQVALGQLVARYGPSVDSGSADATVALWSDDGVFDVGPVGVWTGPEIGGMVEGPGHQGLIHNGCGHVLTAPLVVLDGDRARGWNYAFNIRYDHEADRFWIGRLSANTWEWRREADGWRTVRRVNRNLDGSEEPRSMLRTSVNAGTPPPPAH
jgi:hypothetical protein